MAPALRHAVAGATRTSPLRTRTKLIAAVLIAQSALIACRGNDEAPRRDVLAWSAWVEDAAVQRGYVKAGDVAQFGCPPGWMMVDDTAAALRGRQVSTTYVGSDPPVHDGTITCVAQREFALRAPSASSHRSDPIRRPLSPIWVSTQGDGITIGFRQEVSRSAAVYIGQDTPCGPRLIGVRLGDLLKWLADPASGPNRDFLGMVSAGCPEQSGPRH